MSSGIYAITNTATGERYVGSARNIERRWKIHRQALEAGTHHSKRLQADWDVLGITAFTWQVLEIVREASALREREQDIIDAGRHEYNGVTASIGIEPIVRLGIAFTADDREMLDEIAKTRHPHGYRMQSATIRELIAEEHARMTKGGKGGKRD